MFRLGFWELVVIAVAVTVFIRPQDMPAVFRRLGRMAGGLRRLRNELMDTVRRFEREVRESEKDEDEK